MADVARVALTTLGCKVNYAEMAELAGALAAAGLEVVPDDQRADVHVINSCGVTLQADATTRQRLNRLRRQDPASHIILTGCSVDANPGHYTTDGAADAVMDNRHKRDIADYILGIVGASHGAGRAADPPTRSRLFLKAQDGCNHRCTYCVVWQARGRSESRPLEDLLEVARRAVDSGYTEIVLTGIDLGSWGRDIGLRLEHLVSHLLDVVGDACRIRLSSINSNDVGRGLIELNAAPGLCPHWHLPLQSGSDAVLRAMHRGYRRAQYLATVAALRASDDRTEITSDIMVAFPGESDADHQATISLIAETEMLAAHVFRWSPRPGTPASDMDGRVDQRTSRRRSAEVIAAAAISGRRRHQRQIGQVLDVVWDRVVDDVAHGIADTYFGVTVNCATRPGARSQVLIEELQGDGLRGRLCTP